jgi:hypothetical protein
LMHDAATLGRCRAEQGDRDAAAVDEDGADHDGVDNGGDDGAEAIAALREVLEGGLDVAVRSLVRERGPG